MNIIIEMNFVLGVLDVYNQVDIVIISEQQLNVFVVIVVFWAGNGWEIGRVRTSLLE